MQGNFYLTGPLDLKFFKYHFEPFVIFVYLFTSFIKKFIYEKQKLFSRCVLDGKWHRSS